MSSGIKKTEKWNSEKSGVSETHNWSPVTSGVTETGKWKPVNSGMKETQKLKSVAPGINGTDTKNSVTSKIKPNTVPCSPFGQEKSSVIGELKDRLSDAERGVVEPKGYKLPLPQGDTKVDVTNPEDPTVKRIVYNQYREMLRSYRTVQ